MVTFTTQSTSRCKRETWEGRGSGGCSPARACTPTFPAAGCPSFRNSCPPWWVTVPPHMCLPTGLGAGTLLGRHFVHRVTSRVSCPQLQGGHILVFVSPIVLFSHPCCFGLHMTDCPKGRPMPGFVSRPAGHHHVRLLQSLWSPPRPAPGTRSGYQVDGSRAQAGDAELSFFDLVVYRLPEGLV